METTKLTLELQVNEVNVILSTLSELPFKQVSDLIVKIREQAIPQIAVASAAE